MKSIVDEEINSLISENNKIILGNSNEEINRYNKSLLDMNANKMIKRFLSVCVSFVIIITTIQSNHVFASNLLISNSETIVEASPKTLPVAKWDLFGRLERLEIERKEDRKDREEDRKKMEDMEARSIKRMDEMSMEMLAMFAVTTVISIYSAIKK